MSSQLSKSFHNADFGFVPPGTTSVPKPRFMPKPLHARKMRGQDYDPSLTADMGPPDLDMMACPPTKETKKRLPTTEEEKRASEKAIEHLTSKLACFRTRSQPNDTIMRREPEEFAKQWESDIWKQSMQKSDGSIHNYEYAVSLALQELDRLDDLWDKAQLAEDGKEWTGALLFAFQIDKLYDKIQEITCGSQSLDASGKDDRVCPRSDVVSRNPVADPIEAMLNAEQLHKDLSPEQRRRRSNRRALRAHILDICKMFEPADQMANLDAVALAASWENRLWNVSFGHSDRTTEYNEGFETADDDLQEWKTYWDSTDGDCSGNRTGRQLFVDHIQEFHTNQLHHTARNGPLNEGSASDEQETLKSGDDSDIHENDSDIGSEDEYDHGLDLQIADDLFDLAGGYDTASDHSVDNDRGNGLSSKVLESSCTELVSPCSTKSYESSDDDDACNDPDLVSPRSSEPYHSGDDDDTDETLERAAQDQSDKQSAASSVPYGPSSAPSFNAQTAEPAQKQSINTFHGTLASSSHPQLGNNISSSGVTAATGVSSQGLSKMTVPDHGVAQVAEDTAMNGLAYHPLSDEVEMLDDDANTPAPKGAVNATPSGLLTSDPATAMEDTEMSGGDDSEVLDDNGKPPASAFTFKPPPGGFVPVIPSGFDPGSWSGGFDFKPSVDDDTADSVSSSCDDVGMLKTTEVQQPQAGEQVSGVGADDGHDTLSSSLAGIDVDATSVPEDTKQESAIEPQKVQVEDCSDRIRELAAAIRTHETYWLDVNSGNNAPSAFIEIAEDLRIIAVNITNEGDFSSPLALSKIEALFTNWQAFIDTIKAYIDITTLFHPDWDYRFERFAEQYRLDMELMSEYESLSHLPGAPDLWLNEANKLRKANNGRRESMKLEISTMQGLYQAYHNALSTLRIHIDREALKKIADETLLRLHTNIMKASEAFDLQHMEIVHQLSDPQDCGSCAKIAQDTSVYTKRKTPSTNDAIPSS